MVMISQFFRQCISQRLEGKFRVRLGPSPSNQGSIRIWIRVVQRTNDGVSYEVDQRHAELIVQELGWSSSSQLTVGNLSQCERGDHLMTSHCHSRTRLGTEP